jgi:hypothetical protein
MKTDTHTQGPWYITDEGSQIVVQTFSDHPTGTLARIYRADKLAHSDARLIAAAPDLLEALQDLLNYAGGWDAPADHPCGRARAAIAKAKGGEA